MREFSLIYFKGCFEPKAPPFEVNRQKNKVKSCIRVKSDLASSENIKTPIRSY